MSADRHVVRIGQRGWTLDRAATSLDEVQCGVDLLWVEIDGHRFESVVDAKVGSIDWESVTVPAVTVRIAGPVEIVYCSPDGEPLPGDSDGGPQTVEDGEFAYGTITDAAS